MAAPLTAPGSDALVDSLASPAPAPSPAIPHYLQSVYWWAYIHPSAIRFFERGWLVNAILFGQYARLRDWALDALGAPTVHGHTLQVACVYGNLTPRLVNRLAPDATLQVLDIVPAQLANLRAKLPHDERDAIDARITLTAADASAMHAVPDDSVDQALLFFLLHEQPDAVRRATLAEVLRVLKPGGQVVLVDYHRPSAWNPLRALMRGIVFKRLEPYALDLWTHDLTHFLPDDAPIAHATHRTWFGGLYQGVTLHKAGATSF